jgi:hypothetical protein
MSVVGAGAMDNEKASEVVACLFSKFFPLMMALARVVEIGWIDGAVAMDVEEVIGSPSPPSSTGHRLQLWRLGSQKRSASRRRKPATSRLEKHLAAAPCW